MEKSEWSTRNDLIIDLHNQGISDIDISKELGVSKLRIKRVIQEMKNNPVIETEDKKEFKKMDYLKGNYDFENQFDNPNYDPSNEKINFRKIEITAWDIIIDGNVKNCSNYFAEDLSKYEQLGLLTTYLETLKNDILNS